jgi:hypothetical protein
MVLSPVLTQGMEPEANADGMKTVTFIGLLIFEKVNEYITGFFPIQPPYGGNRVDGTMRIGMGIRGLVRLYPPGTGPARYRCGGKLPVQFQFL